MKNTNTLIKTSSKLDKLYNELYHTDYFCDEVVNLEKYFPHRHFSFYDDDTSVIVEATCKMISISNKENKPIFCIAIDTYEYEYIVANLEEIENVLHELLLKAKVQEENDEKERAQYDLRNAMDELKNTKIRAIELENRISKLQSISKIKRK